MLARTLFLLLAGFLLLPTPWSSPPLALALGVMFGLACRHPYPTQSRTVANLLLQVSVVALGFAMDLLVVLRAGASGFV